MELLQGPPPVGATRILSAKALPAEVAGMSNCQMGRMKSIMQRYRRIQWIRHDAPAGRATEFLGEVLEDTTASGVAGRYMAWLERVIADAERTFALVIASDAIASACDVLDPLVSSREDR